MVNIQRCSGNFTKHVQQKIIAYRDLDGNPAA